MIDQKLNYRHFIIFHITVFQLEAIANRFLRENFLTEQ